MSAARGTAGGGVDDVGGTAVPPPQAAPPNITVTTRTRVRAAVFTMTTIVAEARRRHHGLAFPLQCRYKGQDADHSWPGVTKSAAGVQNRYLGAWGVRRAIQGTTVNGVLTSGDTSESVPGTVSAAIHW